MPFLPLPTRPCSGGGSSAAAMEPAGLEQILKELLLPDTERIRRVWACRTGPGEGGGCGKGPVLTSSLSPGYGAAPARPSGPFCLACALRPVGLSDRPSGELPASPCRNSEIPQCAPGPAQPPSTAVLVCSSSPSSLCLRFSLGWLPLLTLDPPVCSGPDPQKAEYPLATLAT